MKKSIFILNGALCILFVFCTCTSKNKENNESITKCRVLLKQAVTAPISEFSLPLGLKFGMSEKEVYKIMNDHIVTNEVSKVDREFFTSKYELEPHSFLDLNNAFNTNFTPSSKHFKSLVSFSFRNDSLYKLCFTVGDSFNYGLDFTAHDKKILIQELTKTFPSYDFFSCKLGFDEKKDPDTFTERDFWIKNNIVISLEFEPYDNRCYVAYTNAPLSTPRSPLESFDFDFKLSESVKNKLEESKSKPENKNTSNKSAIEEIRKEPKVIEAFLTDANFLYVSVQDDGTRRDGYAEYLCQIIKEHNATINCVKVVKVGSTKDPNRDNAYGVLLGESYCK